MVDGPAISERREVRILALDVGSKRIGLAVSDPLGITAQGLEVLIRQNPQADLERLVEVARQWGVQQIVVGLPRHMDGRLGSAAPQILELVEVLHKTLGVEVVTWEERLTTVEAERVLITSGREPPTPPPGGGSTGGSAHLAELPGPPAAAPGCLNFYPPHHPSPRRGAQLTAYGPLTPDPLIRAPTGLSTLKFFSPRPQPRFPEKWDEPRLFSSFSGVRLRYPLGKMPGKWFNHPLTGSYIS